MLLYESKEDKVERIRAKEDQEAFDKETGDENSNTLKPFNHETLPNPTTFIKIAKEKECIDKTVACFVESIHEFMHIEPDDDPDSKVIKLEELKELLKDEKDREQFDDLIEEAKAVKLLKEASEDIAKTIRLLLMTLRILKMVVIMKSSQTTIGQKNTRMMIPRKHLIFCQCCVHTLLLSN